MSPLVLVVEDDAAIRGLTAAILDGHGYEIVQAEDGRVAIEFLRRRRPDVVLLDIQMPEVDGWGVLDHIRSMALPPRVVISTGMHEVVPPGDLSQYIVGYLIKPFRVEQVLKICELALTTPPVVLPQRDRKEPRRTFLVETTLLSKAGTPLVQGTLVEISRHGLRLELEMAAGPDDPIWVAFSVPGRAQPVRLAGIVRWRQAGKVGVEITEPVSAEDEETLRQLLEG